MAITNLGNDVVTGRYLWPPIPESRSVGQAFVGLITLGNTTNKTAFVGPVVWSDGGTHNISKVGFKTNNVTAGTGSTFRVSLQDVDATNGPPSRPDGTADQSFSTTTMPTANTWTTYTLTSTRNSVTHGDMLSVVFELTVFGSSTAIQISGVLTDQYAYPDCITSAVRYDGSWTAYVGALPIVVFESDDGTPVYGTLGTSGINSAITLAGATDSSPPAVSAIANYLTLPYDVKIDAIWAEVTPQATKNFALLVLNSSAVSVAQVTVDYNQIRTTGAQYYVLPIEPVTLTAGSYYVVVLPLSSGTVQSTAITVDTAGYLELLGGGLTCQYVERDSSLVWGTPVATKRLMAGVRIVGIDAGAISTGGTNVSRLINSGGF